ncbi:DUF6233 domain-containing protein [Streptomyces sp. NPDC046994]|uniref:DUF6233 domain-containing protein n=1 Tax=Streptomyces sp. NPDC046994 TaxID=3155735 RepID=UPI003455352D
MTSAELPPPQVRVTLPDGQEILGRLYARQRFERGGWMYWVGLPMWADVPETESVEPREYRVWLRPEQVDPLDGVSYEAVPTYGPPRKNPASFAQADDRWAWKVQRKSADGGQLPEAVVHVWDCTEAPAGAEEMTVFDALDVLRAPGSVPCSKCGADVALGPLIDST